MVQHVRGSFLISLTLEGLFLDVQSPKCQSTKNVGNKKIQLMQSI